MLTVFGITSSPWLKIWCLKMSQPDFMPNGSPIRKPNLPYAEPNVPTPFPKGFPKGISPPPKSEVNPNNVPRNKEIDLSKPSRDPIDLTKPGKKPIDLNKPKPKWEPTKPPRTRIRLKRKLFKNLAEEIIEEALDPEPTADGTLPNYDREFDDDDATENQESEDSICGELCAPKYMLSSRPAGSQVLHEFEVSQGFFPSGGSTVGYFYGFIPEQKSLGYVQVWDRPGLFDGPPSFSTVQYVQCGFEQDPIGTVPRRRRYKFAFRQVSVRRYSQKIFIGKWGYRWSVSLRPEDPTPMESNNWNGLSLYVDKAAPDIRETYRCGAIVCNDGEDETQEPDEYDREDDGEAMACKWKPTNDVNVEQLEIQNFTYNKFVECRLDQGFNDPYFEERNFNAPKCVGDVLVTLLNDRARIEGQKCSASSPFEYWNVKPGNQSTLYAGVPPIPSLEVALPLGSVNIGITFDATNAKNDTSLRNLKRIGNGNGNDNTFVNTMRIWLIDASGNAISDQELWVPSTLISIPFQYREQVCKIRMMPKSMTVTFTVFDTGDRWEVKKREPV